MRTQKQDTIGVNVLSKVCPIGLTTQRATAEKYTTGNHKHKAGTGYTIQKDVLFSLYKFRSCSQYILCSSTIME
jgi:hypothetical protein